MAIPFVDLGAQYQTIKNEMDKAIQGCIQNTAFIGGSEVAQFGRTLLRRWGPNFVSLVRMVQMLSTLF